jgi:hypothetical protein
MAEAGIAYESASISIGAWQSIAAATGAECALLFRVDS